MRYFEDITISKKPNSAEIPDIYYAVYKNIIAINHFKNEAFVFAHTHDGSNNIDQILKLINSKNFAAFEFNTEGDTHSNLTDEEFKEHVASKSLLEVMFFNWYCHEDLIKNLQVTISMVSCLRSINPIILYFDYGDFKIFGSSPEAQW